MREFGNHNNSLEQFGEIGVVLITTAYHQGGQGEWWPTFHTNSRSQCDKRGRVGEVRSYISELELLISH